MLKQLILAASVVALGALSACQTANPDIVSRNDAQRMSSVQDGTILSIRPVTIDGSQSGGGGAAGAIAGGVAGSNVGGPRGSVLVGLAGAIAGGVIGNAAERAATKEDGVEILVQLKNGERRSIVQGKGAEVLAAGDPVIMVTTGGKVRVMKAPPVSQ
jgi:outer membrane lipoprotein SlyB